MPPREILTVAEMSAADKAADAPGSELMERAGAAVADAITARFTPRPTAVLCGPGNNGGDGYVVARQLKQSGWNVSVYRDLEPKGGDAAQAAARWDGPCHPLSADALSADLVVDA